MKKNSNSFNERFSSINLDEIAGYAIDYLTTAKIKPLQQQKDEIQAQLDNETDEQKKQTLMELLSNYDALMLPWAAKRVAAAGIYKLTTGEEYPGEF